MIRLKQCSWVSKKTQGNLGLFAGYTHAKRLTVSSKYTSLAVVQRAFQVEYKVFLQIQFSKNKRFLELRIGRVMLLFAKQSFMLA